MKPKYKVHDKVTIIKRTGEDNDYRFCFIDEMAAFAGRTFEITRIEDRTSSSGAKIPDDGYLYHLDGVGWSWASSMFTLAKEKPETINFTKDRKHYQFNFSV